MRKWNNDYDTEDTEYPDIVSNLSVDIRKINNRTMKTKEGTRND